jgi:hypothetical protein
MRFPKTILLVLITIFIFVEASEAQSTREIAKVLKDHILKESAWAMNEPPVTVTSSVCTRSAGGKHDFYSEGDYWWPDPENPGGPYIQGME